MTSGNANKTKIMTITIGVMAVIVAGVGVATAYSSVPAGDLLNEGQSNDKKGIISRPPPREWSIWGQDVSSINRAIESTDLSGVVLPTYVPEGFKIASIRPSVSEDGNSRFVAVVYAPEGVTARDEDTFEGVMENGGVLMLYSHQVVGEKYNQTRHLEKMIEQGKGVRTLTTVNGYPAIVAQGDSELGITSSVVVYGDDNNLIDIVSLKQKTDTLLKIAQSVDRSK
jgi:hypothetical protein